MPREFVTPVSNLRLPAVPAASNLPAPTGLAQGIDIRSWAAGSIRPTRAHFRIWGPIATLGSVAVWGQENIGGIAVVQFLGLLNNGGNISIGGPITGGFLGYGEAVDLIGIFDYLMLSAASGGASHLYDVMPLEMAA